MIVVTNKKDNKYEGEPFKVYIGRPSPLGNPYSHVSSKFSNTILCEARDEAIRRFAHHFDYMMNINKLNHSMRKEIERLIKIYKKYGKLVLECWCKPKPCHGDIIKKYIKARCK